MPSTILMLAAWVAGMLSLLQPAIAGDPERTGLPSTAPSPRPRVLVLSGFPPLDVIPGGARGGGPAEKRSDPDDLQSMVRFLLDANDLEVEGLVASAGTFANVARKANILAMLELYDRVDVSRRETPPRFCTSSVRFGA